MRAAQLQDELKSARHEVEALSAKLASSKLDDILSGAVTVGAVKLATASFEGMQIDVARSMADEIKANYADTVAIIAINTDGKVNFIAVAGKDAVAAGAHAGKLVGAVAAVTGGKGGGRPDNAMTGGRDAAKIAEALASAEAALSGMLK
jgi:alanyl-tRNA synthetase